MDVLVPKQRHIVLYFPGLGDSYDSSRQWALHIWRLWGVETRLVPLKWYAGGSFDDKLSLAKGMIEQALREDASVSLVGESAGASLVANVAGLYPDLHKIVTIAGVNSSHLSISPIIQRRSPSFDESAKRVSKAFLETDPQKIHTFYGFMDGSVPIAFSRVTGARSHRVLAIGHLLTIIVCLTILSPYIAKIIKHP